ncbi:hypothetical protein PQX77_012994 [Marasmius sp. AFHP31]|nr:hypothetical protein PQX77_012994 [Marasmius sp. AFHP31]
MSTCLLEQLTGHPVAHRDLDDLKSAYEYLVPTALHHIEIVPSNARDPYVDPVGLQNQVANLFNILAFALNGMQDLRSPACIFYGRYAPQPDMASELEDTERLRSLFDDAAQAMSLRSRGMMIAAEVEEEGPLADFVVNQMRASQWEQQRKMH